MPELRNYAELTLISLSLCLGVVSLCLSDWITIENPVKTGYVKFGLIQKCDRVHQRPEEFCTTLDDRPFEWWLAACLLGGSIMSQIFTLLLTLIRLCRRCSRFISHSRINQLCIGLSVLSVFMLSTASIAFPAGFHMDAIGGAPFRLPENVSLTSAYFIFYTAVISSFIHFLVLIVWRI